MTLAAILWKAGQAHELPCLPAAPITHLSPMAPARQTRGCGCPQPGGHHGFSYLSLQTASSNPAMSLAYRGPWVQCEAGGFFSIPLSLYVQTCPEIKLTPMSLTLANLQRLGLMGHGDRGQSIKTRSKERQCKPRETQRMLEHRAETLSRSSKMADALLSSIR